jgi:hypothetical protein
MIILYYIMDTNIEPTTAILCGFNINDLESVIYDLIHMTYACKEKLNITNILIITDDDTKFKNAYLHESIRLLNKKSIKCLIDLENIKIINISHHNFTSLLYDTINNITDKQILLSISCHGYTSSHNPNNKTESDNKDEYICINNQRILDDDLFNSVNIPNKQIFCLIDTCSSGTMLDLPYVYDIQQNTSYMENNLICKPEIFTLSACKDTEYDSDSFSNIYGYGGGLTSVFLDYICTNKKINIFTLINFIKENTKINCLLSSSKKINNIV